MSDPFSKGVGVRWETEYPFRVVSIIPSFTFRSRSSDPYLFPLVGTTTVFQPLEDVHQDHRPSPLPSLLSKRLSLPLVPLLRFFPPFSPLCLSIELDSHLQGWTVEPELPTSRGPGVGE